MGTRKVGCAACREDQLIFPFTMAFQPIVDLREHCIDAHEALVRGPNREPAGDIFARVTDQNLYAFDQACRVKAIELAARFRLQGQLNINFLPNAVYDPKACIRKTLDTAARTGFPLDRLTFEFTEEEAIVDATHLVNIIAEYRRHGFKIAIDDFGTSYSGLSRLIDLRPDIIKLDKNFVRDIDTDRLRQAVVAGVASIGAETGIKVVAEGFERREEVEAALASGVRYMQGYFFCKPVFEGVALDTDLAWPADAGE
jgi:EAL domain-containing protein (putative c-di-GMP-specific phosphodiesterase class I)